MYSRLSGSPAVLTFVAIAVLKIVAVAVLKIVAVAVLKSVAVAVLKVVAVAVLKSVAWTGMQSWSRVCRVDAYRSDILDGMEICNLCHKKHNVNTNNPNALH